MVMGSWGSWGHRDDGVHRGHGWDASLLTSWGVLIVIVILIYETKFEYL
jgi:hypothetical protein